MKTKLEQLQALISAGDRRGAILLAAKFPRLGDRRGAVLSGREALLRPDFQRALGRDPDALIAAGWAAVREGWGSGGGAGGEDDTR